MRWLLALFCLSVASVSQAAFTETIIRKPVEPSAVANQPLIDKVTVIKSERRLQLISRGEPLKTYRISWASNPKAPKSAKATARRPKACTGLTGARSVTASTWPCTFPTRTSAMPPAPAARA